MRSIGFVLMVAAFTYATRDALSAMYSTEGILLVLLGTLCLVRFAGVHVWAMFRAGFSRRATEEQMQAAIFGWRMARLCALGMGLLGTLIGAILMMRNLNDPAAIGPGMSLAVTTILYAAVAAPFYLAVQARLESRVHSPSDGSILGSAVTATVVAMLAPLVMTFALLLAFAGPPTPAAAPQGTPPAAVVPEGQAQPGAAH
jgi:hypothetical protein